MKRTIAHEGQVILDTAAMGEKIKAIAQSIAKEFGDQCAGIGLVGIQTRGVPLAKRIAAHLKQETGIEIPVGILDITLYRDDVHAIADQPEVKETDLPFEIEDRPLVLVDDVLFTGRTIRSAMNALIDYGRPGIIRLAVLVDRGYRELPIGADYVGLQLKTNRDDIVDVNFREVDEEDNIRLRQRGHE